LGCVRVLGATLAAFVLLAAPAWSRNGPVQLGTALNSGGLDAPAYLDAVRRYDAVTPESALKLEELQPEQGRYDFAFGDRMVGWARANGKPMHGTTLIWCYDDVLPAWLRSRTWSRAELLAVMRDHITTVMDHYEGRVPAWDVVNEAFAANGSRRDCLWQRVIGDGWIEFALHAARDADPNAKLFYNETAADFPNAKFGAVEAMAKDFKARGVPLDGIGLQNHLLNGSAPLQFLAEDAMRRIGALGLAVQISELDAFISQFGGTAAEALDRQAQAFQTVASACQAVDACFRVTMWGAADHWSWRGIEQKAVALDGSYREKPGWWGLQEAIGAAGPPTGVPPSPPGRPVASAAPNAGVFGVSWAAAWDPEGDPVNYVLEHRDADDTGWSSVASGIRSLGFSFVGGRLERQGTYRYRVRASDGRTPGGWSAESAPVVVDRADPAPPSITPDRAPDGGGWYRDRATLSFAGAGDPLLADGSAGSGVDPATVPAPSTFATAGSHTVSGTVRDRAGNASRSATATVRVDTTAPQAALACPQPVQAGEPASATWTASDTGSGLAGPATGSLPLDTTRAGTFTARYEAIDVAGHRTPATCTYVVEPTPEPDPEPTPSPTASPTASPTPEPTASPTAEPTASPTAEPTSSSTASPPASPTAESTPTGSPTSGSSAEPTSEPFAQPKSGSSAVPWPEPFVQPTAEAPTEPLVVRARAPSLRRTSRVARDGRVRVTLGCAAACSGRVSLKSKRRTLAVRRFSASAGRVRVALRLPKRDRRTLARSGRLRVRVVIAPAGGGAAARRVTLRRG
jgi:endo-1,4-beta-xylanase